MERSNIAVISTQSIALLRSAVINGLDSISEYLKTTKEDDFLRHKAKIGISVLSSFARLNQTERAKDATQFLVLKHLAKDENEMEKYIKSSMPHLVPASKK